MKKLVSHNHIKKLQTIVSDVYTEIDLSMVSRWRIGGVADCLVCPRNSIEVSRTVQYLSANNIPYIVIGSTSNLLFSDEGLRAVAIQIGTRMSDYKVEGNNVWVQAGKWVPGFARNVAMAGLSGIEHTCGIPGTIGGLIYMNGGSQRKGIGSHIKSVTAVSPNGEIQTFNKKECLFEYRSSIFQNIGHLITEAEFKFNEKKNYSTIRDEMLDILNTRRKKFPQRIPNCGSTFISNPNIYHKYGPPGAVIESLGYKGFRKGDAVVSSEHANFINNVGKAKASDVLYLIKKIRNGVHENTGFEMRAEVRYVTKTGIIKPAHLA